MCEMCNYSADEKYVGTGNLLGRFISNAGRVAEKRQF